MSFYSWTRYGFSFYLFLYNVLTFVFSHLASFARITRSVSPYCFFLFSIQSFTSFIFTPCLTRHKITLLHSNKAIFFTFTQRRNRIYFTYSIQFGMYGNLYNVIFTYVSMSFMLLYIFAISVHNRNTHIHYFGNIFCCYSCLCEYSGSSRIELGSVDFHKYEYIGGQYDIICSLDLNFRSANFTLWEIVNVVLN